MEDREEIPPHHPTHGIHLSDNEIESIINACIPPPSTGYTISRLPHGKSFNNRIYLIEDVNKSEQSYVLKVNGQFWGPEKVENEVSCLRILQQFCPEVPTPRIIAWSRDGYGINRSEAIARRSQSTSNVLATECRRGWILMTRLPGEPIDPAALTETDMSRLSTQLARLVANWRFNVPTSECCGNLRFRSDRSASNTSRWKKAGIDYDVAVDIEGILEIGLSRTDRQIDSLLCYWKTRLSNALRKLNQEAVYIANRGSVKYRVEQFLTKTLPALSIFQDSHKQVGGFIFSHIDLAPRNVLVSASPLRISGILDFEFSGFFPWMQDFTGKSIVSEDDDEEGWPVAMHAQILQKLDDQGIMTPLRLKGSNLWIELMNLSQLETYIAPWWLSADGINANELEKELGEARSKVDEALSVLESNSSM